MADDVKITRKSHIKRYYKDDNPKDNPDTWIDLERLDELRLLVMKRYPWREYVWKFNWNNVDSGADEHVTKKKIRDPTEDKTTPPDNVIEIPTRDMIFVTTGRQQHFQGYKHYFANHAGNASRETHSRRIYHHDIDDSLLDGTKQPPRDSDAYKSNLGKQDKDRYVDVEIIDKYWSKQVESRDTHGNIKPSQWQEKKWILDQKTDPLLREPLLPSDVPGGDPPFQPRENPSGGGGGGSAGTVIIDPPWRLDPLQNIVNVSWPTGELLAVEFGDGATDAPGKEPPNKKQKEPPTP